MKATPIASFLLLLLASLSALADPVILSITPASGPTAGGTEITLHGTDLTCVCGPILCLPPTVFFGGVPATETRIVNDSTVVATTPPSLPGAADVSYVAGLTQTPVLPKAFEFTGPVPATFERILLPVFVPPVHGAFGSEFHTALTLTGKWMGYDIFGIGVSPVCDGVGSCIGPQDPWHVAGGDTVEPRQLDYAGRPGRFAYVRKSEVDNVFANLRVYDVSRSALDYGVEIPVVRERDFRERAIVLTGVPGDARFRNTLRIYGAGAYAATIRINNGSPIHVPMRAGESIHDPTYAEFTDFPTGVESFRVTVIPPSDPILAPVEAGRMPVWAFITVTNNETQVISTITPQP